MSGEDDGIGRRRLLAVGATTAVGALAGCAERLGFGEEDTPTLDGDRLAELADRPVPSVPETLPVAIESTFVDAQAGVARALLAGVPAPFDEREIPNGAIRERLNGTYEAARGQVRRVLSAETPFEAAHRVPNARADAREVHATWQAIDADRTVADVQADAPDVVEAVDSCAARWSYLGADPVAAVRVHAAIEEEVHGARNWASPDAYRSRPGEGPFDVGRAASRLERARASLAIADHLFERHRAGLDTGRDLRARLSDARDALDARVDDARAALPEADPDREPSGLVERDVGQTAGVLALADLYDRADHRGSRGTDDDPIPRLAGDVLGATRVLVAVRAFERLRDRIEGGDDVAIASVADVEALRGEAVDAVTAAREAERAAGLVAELLPRYANALRWTDDEFGHESGAVPVNHVARDAADYVTVGASCAVLPDVCASVAATLRNGG